MNSKTSIKLGGLLSVALLVLPVFGIHAATCTAVLSGNWNSSSTWSCGRTPAAGDVLIIPVGRTVTVTGNHGYSGSLMRVRVYGALFFNGGGSKISLPCGSIVEAMTPSASISGNGGGSSQTIKICNTTYWSASDGPVNGYSAWPDNSTLPVELLYFKATSLNGMVQLTWATATESGCDHFRVERSTGLGDWDFAGQLEGAGNAQELITYSLLDGPGEQGTWYYRLLQFDLDGTLNDLGTVAVDLKNTNALACYPNPSYGPVRVRVGKAGGVLEIRDRSGSLLRSIVLDKEVTDLDLSELPVGMYILRYTCADVSAISKLSVVR